MKDFLKIWISEKRDIFLVPLEVTENGCARENFLVPFKVTENFSWRIGGWYRRSFGLLCK